MQTLFAMFVVLFVLFLISAGSVFTFIFPSGKGRGSYRDGGDDS